MNAVTLFAADGDVLRNVCAQCLQRLHKQGSGGLSVHIEIAPDADPFPGMEGLLDAFHGGLDTGEGDRSEQFRVQEGAGLLRGRDAAPDESLRDERVQAQVPKGDGDVHRSGIKPAGHLAGLYRTV